MEQLRKDLERARDDGVEENLNLPFLLTPPDCGPLGIVLIHGFSASPREMRPLGERLARTGVTVYGVRLPGHGTSPEDLAGRYAEEWLQTVAEAFSSMQQRGLRVSLGGLSTGAVLALRLALEYPVDRLLLLAPFLRLKHRLAPWVRWLHPFVPYQQRDLAETDRPYYYSRRPLTGVAQINRLCRQLRGRLDEITAPALLLTSTGDTTIAAGTTVRIHRELGSPTKILHVYGDDVPHAMLAEDNPRREDVLARCRNFLLSNGSSAKAADNPDKP